MSVFTLWSKLGYKTANINHIFRYTPRSGLRSIGIILPLLGNPATLARRLPCEMPTPFGITTLAAWTKIKQSRFLWWEFHEGMLSTGGLASWQTEAISRQAIIRELMVTWSRFLNELIFCCSLRFAALRPYGNPSISDHWDIMHMPVRNIQVLPYNQTNSTTHGGH